MDLRKAQFVFETLYWSEGKSDLAEVFAEIGGQSTLGAGRALRLRKVKLFF